MPPEAVPMARRAPVGEKERIEGGEERVVISALGVGERVDEVRVKMRTCLSSLPRAMIGLFCLFDRGAAMQVGV